MLILLINSSHTIQICLKQTLTLLVYYFFVPNIYHAPLSFTDNIRNDLSRLLYQYMCQNIVGCQDYVKTNRMIRNVRDNLFNNDVFVCITSGSIGEGLEMKGSDFDEMFVLKYVEVHETMLSVVKDEKKTYFTIYDEDTEAGFTSLALMYTKSARERSMCLNDKGKLLLSNVLFKNFLSQRSEFLIFDHGPCLSDKDGFFDRAFCLHSKSWLTVANMWITRQNKAWPSTEVKQNIVDHGVLFVPIGVKGSYNEEIEWRLSFSVGEKLLIYTFCHTQLLCYALLKILLKDVISVDMRCKELLCSYFIKTIIFWVSEELQPSVWTPDNLIPCFMKCFQRLIYCVDYSVCPHYFIPEKNLFANKIYGLEQEHLLNNLNSIYSYGWRCIFLSPQIPRFDLLPNQHIPVNAFTTSFKHIIHSSSIFMLSFRFFLLPFRNYFQSVNNLRFVQSTRLQRVHLYFISVLGGSVSQKISISSCYNNKYLYQQNKTCLSYLLRNIHHDVVSGWLMLASYFYKTKQYNIALKILLYSLSKCSLEKIRFDGNVSDVHTELTSLPIIQKKGIFNSLKMLVIQNISFHINSTLIPPELEMESPIMLGGIPPVVYAQFLRVLCHYYLKPNREYSQYRKLISELKVIITKECFLSNNTNLAVCYNLLGVALQLLGKMDDANQAFVQSVELEPRQDVNIACSRLSFIN